MTLGYIAILASGALLWGTLLSPLLALVANARSGTIPALWQNWILCFVCGLAWIKFFSLPKEHRAIWMFFVPLIGLPLGIALGTIRGILVPTP